MPNNDSAMDVAHKGVQFRPGENLYDKRYYIQYPKDLDDKERWADFQANPQFFAERWWEDGTVLAGGREFTAMSASGCYTRGKMSCLSCHSMHQAPPEDQLTLNPMPMPPALNAIRKPNTTSGSNRIPFTQGILRK